MTSPFSIIKNMLWDEYGYLLPSDPSHMTKQIIDSLNNQGYKIEYYILDDNPKNMFGRESKEINGTT